jgi:hypothetical protein
MSGGVEHEHAFRPAVGVDGVDGVVQELFLVGDLLRELLAGHSGTEPRGDLHRADHPDGDFRPRELERPTQRRGGVVAAVETDDHPTERMGVPPVGNGDDRNRGVRGAVPGDRAQAVPSQFAAPGPADDQGVGVRGGVDQLLSCRALDDERGDRRGRAHLFDGDVEFVPGRGSETEFVDAEPPLRREQRHHRRHVEYVHGGEPCVVGGSVLDGPAKCTERRIRPVDADDPVCVHASSLPRRVPRDQ